jgi:CRISPR-associated protein Csx10
MSELKALDQVFNIKLKMESDWHIGSGTGRPGDIDSLVRRDHDDLPYVPAKTLTGIWRDACETVARGLDGDGESGVWQRWVTYLFGDQPAAEERGPQEGETGRKKWQEEKARLESPRQALLSVRSAHLANDLRDALKAKRQLREAVTFVKPGIKIDPRTGQTITDFLRFEEMARVDAELTAQCRWYLPQHLSADQRMVASALVIAGAAFVERIGGNRRRGAGRCKLTVDGVTINNWLDWLYEHVKASAQFAAPPPRDEGNRVVADGSLLSQPVANGDWISLTLRVEAQTRVIIPDRIIGNVVKSLDHIPGTYLLPFITRKLGALGLDVRTAIARGDLLVTNATPVIKQSTGSGIEESKEIELLTRPVPFNLQYEKLGGGFNEGRGVYNVLTEQKPENKQLKGYRAGHVSAFDGKTLPAYVTTKLAVETHNVVDDTVQRPTSEVGGVFSYQAIAQGEVLCAELRLRESLLNGLSEDKRKDWQASLSDDYYLGRARKDDYGSVKISIVEKERSPQSATDDGTTAESEQTQTPTELRVWLLSDVLLRDERLRPTASIDQFASVLGKALNVDLKPRRQAKHDCKDDKSTSIDFAARQHRTDSWHTRWGLPRPTLAGLAAGSCFVLDIPEMKCDSKTLEKNLMNVAVAGIGERRAEGYGQVCFNDPFLTDEISKATSPDRSPNEKKPASAASGDYARLIESEGWRKEIRRRSLALAESEDWRTAHLGFIFTRDDGQPNSKPTTSQLGALRSTFGQLRNQHASEKDNPVGKWISTIKQREQKWPDGLGKISKLCTDGQEIWTLLEKDAQEKAWPTVWQELTITPDGEGVLKNELWAEAVRTLLDACIRAHKRQLEEKQSKAGRAAKREER